MERIIRNSLFYALFNNEPCTKWHKCEGVFSALPECFVMEGSTEKAVLFLFYIESKKITVVFNTVNTVLSSDKAQLCACTFLAI